MTQDETKVLCNDVMICLQCVVIYTKQHVCNISVKHLKMLLFVDEVL